MTEEIKAAVRRQFGANAASYVTSAVHARGSDLPLLVALAGLTGRELVLDVATAAGHTALALAPGAAHVTGVDLTAEMLVEARRQAALKGIGNVTFSVADAEHLPFPDDRFDVVTCRIAAHHFPNVAAFCREAARVLRPGGLLLVVDNVALEDDELDSFINTVEKLRDPSHFRAFRLSEWQGYVEAAGLGYTVAHQFITAVEREAWLTRMNPAPSVADDVRRRLAGAPDRVKEAFAITADGFQLYKAIIVGRKPGVGTVAERTRAQYGRQAAGYTSSQGHAAGPDLRLLLERLPVSGSEEALDVATGTGHAALALATRVAHVTGLDLTPAMLGEARKLAAARGLADRTDWVEGDVHHLPFPDASFDLVTVRRAPHHFADARSALAEMRRVVRPGGLLGFVDQVSPAHPGAYALIETLERLRDPSHVHAYSAAEWETMFRETGWEVLSLEVQSQEHSFEEWLDLAGCTEAVRDSLLAVLDAATPEALAALGHKEDGGHRSFRKDRVVAVCRR